MLNWIDVTGERMIILDVTIKKDENGLSNGYDIFSIRA